MGGCHGNALLFSPKTLTRRKGVLITSEDDKKISNLITTRAESQVLSWIDRSLHLMGFVLSTLENTVCPGRELTIGTRWPVLSVALKTNSVSRDSSIDNCFAKGFLYTCQVQGFQFWRLFKAVRPIRHGQWIFMHLIITVSISCRFCIASLLFKLIFRVFHLLQQFVFTSVKERFQWFQLKILRTFDQCCENYRK